MIDIKSLSYARGTHQLYQDFSAQLAEGEALLLTGPNGTGKSTLVQLIGGLLKPLSGSIEIDGINLASANSKIQATLRSIAPQRRSFTLAFTVQQVLEFLPKKLRIEESAYIFTQLGLNELLHRKVTELSVGQQERVSLGLALSQRANYYLLDEPFSAQDSESTRRILEIVTELKKEKGVLVISHNQNAISQYFDRVINLA
jgi:ABC-type multidrug transport system ATPase subunit